MKKIISIIASLAITAALIPSAFAHETKALKITTDVTQFTNETFYDYYEEDIPEGYDAYKVVLGLEGLADTLSYEKTAGTTAKPKYSGNTIDLAEIFFETDVSTDAETGNFNNVYSYIIDWSYGATANEGFLTDGENGWYMSYYGTRVYPSTANTEITEINDYMTIGFVIKKGTSATFTLKDATFSIMSYTDDSLVDQTDYESSKNTVSMDPFTLGESKPKPGDIKTEEKTFEGETTKKFLEIYDQKTQPRYVVLDTLSSKKVNAESVLEATYKGKTKTAKLFDLLKVEGGGDGGITIGKLTIKMVLPVNSPKPGADDFSFDVVNK